MLWFAYRGQSARTSRWLCQFIRSSSRRSFYGPFETWLGGRAPTSALLAAALIMGFAISREIGDADLEEPRRRYLYDRLAAMLQACVSL
jgi:hypothetical protein